MRSQLQRKTNYLSRVCGLVFLFLVVPLGPLGGILFGATSSARAETLETSTKLPSTSCKAAWRTLIPKNLHKFTPGEDYPAYLERIRRDECYKDWTILVYMEADNNLSPYAMADLYEMEAGFKHSPSAGASTLKTDLIVQVDLPGEEGLRRLHLFQTSEPYKTHKVEEFKDWTVAKNVQSPLIPDAQGNVALSKTDGKSEAQRLQEFLLWGAAKYPSQHYLVIVWGHGQGWGGIAFSEETKKFLKIPELKTALHALKTQLGRPIDLYASDACLMQTAEVATELADEATYIVGSSQVESFLGLPYRRILYELNKGSFDRVPVTSVKSPGRPKNEPESEPERLSRMIPKIYVQSMQSSSGLQGRMDSAGIHNLTISALSSAGLLTNLIPALSQLSHALDQYLDEDPFRAPDLQFSIKKMPSIKGSTQDLNIFLSILEAQMKDEVKLLSAQTAPSPGAILLTSAIDRLKTLLSLTTGTEATLLAVTFGIDYLKKDVLPNGLSVWLPATAGEYQRRISDFEGSEFYKLTGWSHWLSKLYPESQTTKGLTKTF